jgi:hypothetical protein
MFSSCLAHRKMEYAEMRSSEESAAQERQVSGRFGPATPSHAPLILPQGSVHIQSNGEDGLRLSAMALRSLQEMAG